LLIEMRRSPPAQGFAQSAAIRDRLKEIGVILEDGKRTTENR
jgi:cysteinyl-tRNA synthetase